MTPENIRSRDAVKQAIALQMRDDTRKGLGKLIGKFLDRIEASSDLKATLAEIRKELGIES
jgi:hypothetical protein